VSQRNLEIRDTVAPASFFTRSSVQESLSPVKKHILLPLAVSLCAAPCWANGSVSLSSTSLSFNGSTGNASSQPLKITAVGGAVTIKSLTYSTNVFSGTVALPLRLSRGRSVTITVTAHPQTTASKGTLAITTSVSKPTVSLTETATQPVVSHSVGLSWQAPATTPVAIDSYDVERAAAGSTSFATVGTTTASSTVWSDTSVKSGTSYTYEVVAHSATGETSAPSNVITASIP
jgi:hypothetical protein